MIFPNILSQSGAGDTRQFELEISEELTWFKGHFPGLPVLPGVVQLRWAIELAREHFELQDGPDEIVRLKFKSVVVPPRSIHLSLIKQSDSEATFEYSGSGEIFSQGKLKFAGTTQ